MSSERTTATGRSLKAVSEATTERDEAWRRGVAKAAEMAAQRQASKPSIPTVRRGLAYSILSSPNIDRWPEADRKWALELLGLSVSEQEGKARKSAKVGPKDDKPAWAEGLCPACHQWSMLKGGHRVCLEAQ